MNVCTSPGLNHRRVCAKTSSVQEELLLEEELPNAEWMEEMLMRKKCSLVEESLDVAAKPCSLIANIPTCKKLCIMSDGTIEMA